MVDMSLLEFIIAILVSLMTGGTVGFLIAAILANSKYREMQADLARGEKNP